MVSIVEPATEDIEASDLEVKWLCHVISDSCFREGRAAVGASRKFWKNCPQVSAMNGHVGISLHAELAIILLRDAEAEPFIESDGRVDDSRSQTFWSPPAARAIRQRASNVLIRVNLCMISTISSPSASNAFTLDRFFHSDAHVSVIEECPLSTLGCTGTGSSIGAIKAAMWRTKIAE
jgi:hypothetical protein